MSRPSITQREKDYVSDAMSKGDIGVGEYIGYFEHTWASYNNRKYGVSCNSGTNAIYLALKALGIGPGDEVIVPEYTMIATAWAVSYTGATPVFVDCYDDLLMDLEKIAVTDKTKAIITVPIYGRKMCGFRAEGLNRKDEGKVTEYTRRHIPIIEDMAEAHGIQPKGDIACYSFYGNKILTTGEGGMCITNNPEWADKMRLYANMYMDKERSMLHPKMGHNFRMTNLQAAVGLAQVLRIEEILEKRRLIESWYDENLPESVKMPRRDVLWMYDIQSDRQEKLKAYLEENDIPSRYGFKPMSRQPQYFNPEYTKLNAHKWSKRILYLPTWTDMSLEDVKNVCQKVQQFLEKK